jgi:PAS domain-containing protein
MGLNLSCLILGLLLSAIDLATGPYVQFPFFYLVPVAIAAWYRGRLPGIGLSFLLPLIRPFYFAEFWSVGYSPAIVAVNAGIKVLVFSVFAELIHRVAAMVRFRDQIMESLPVGIWIADRAGTIRRANPAARQLWDMDATGESLLHASVQIRKEGQEGLLDPFDWAWPQAMQAGRSTLRETLEITRADGTRRMVSSSAVPIPMEQGRVGGALLLQQDITEEKRLEAERNRIIQSLEEAWKKIRILRGLLPVCAHCKRVRDESGAWYNMEEYVSRHSEAEFSHGICPDCLPRHYPEFAGRDSASEES